MNPFIAVMSGHYSLAPNDLVPGVPVADIRRILLDGTPTVMVREDDELIAREKQHLKSTELDKALNNDKLTQAAAIFGGNSASTRSSLLCL